MKNLILVCVVAFAFSTTAMAADIAISTQAGWFSQDAADREMQEIVDNVTAVSVERFTADDHDALAVWVADHTGDGVSDLLILCGVFPDTIYPGGNAQPDGSLAELFLDDGNCIVNTGDYMFYVNSAGANNAESGLYNMMDITMDMWDDNTPVVVTAEGQEYTPSLVDYQTDRPFHLDQLTGGWYAELVLAQNAAGTRAEPVIVANAATGGRLGNFYQTSGQDDDPRGEVMSEWINNWFLTVGNVPNAPALIPNPEDGAVDVDAASLEWTPGYGAVSHNVYLSTDATIDESDLVAEETEMAMHFEPLTPGTTYYWRVDEVDADGNVIEGDVWSFSTLPLEAHFPSPGDGAVNVIVTELSWTPGKDTIMHNVNFGTDPAALAPVSMMQTDTSYDAGALDPDTTYYWRVDEFTPAGTVTGPVWSFSTPPVIPITDPNLAGWWKFDEGESLTALDSSGHGGHGSLIGGPQWVDGLEGTALEFSVRGQYVNCGNEAGAGITADYTLIAWVQMAPDNAGQYMGIGGKLKNGAGYTGFSLVRHSSNVFRLWVGDGTTGLIGISSNLTYTDTDWHYVTGVREGQNNILYVDGMRQAATESDFVPSPDFFHIGRQYSHLDDRYFEGIIDDVRLYDYAINENDIRLMAGVEALPWSPEPADGASGLAASVVLAWNPGDYAVEQDVYLGTDADAVAAADATDATGIYRGRQAETTYAAAGLVWGTTQYWRADQIADDGSIVAGTVWSFTIIDSIVLEDFEAYDIVPVDPDPAGLVGRWEFDGDLTGVDGIGPTGTVVGTVAFEDDPVRGQVLSLPGGDDQYVALGSVGISGNMPKTIACWAKADHTDIPDWTLIFGFTGTVDSAGGNGSHFNIGSLGGPGGVGAHVWGWEETIFSDEEALEWHHYAMTYDGTTIQYYGDGVLMDTDTGKSNVMDLSISADRVHVGSRITQASSFPGKVDDARIYNYTLSQAEVAALGGFVPTTLLSYVWTDSGVTSSLGFTAVHGGTKAMSIQYQNDADPFVGEVSAAPLDIDMTQGARGLSLWVLGDPANSADPLYVALEDSAGASASVVNSDAAAAQNGEWTNWVIPLDEFAGVDLTSIVKASFGVGDGQPGGAGTVSVDDISLVGPAALAPLYAEDFESYDAGSDLHGQGGWKGWDNDVAWGAPASDAFAVSGSISVEIGGNADLVHEFDLAGGMCEFSAMQYIPSGTTGTNYFILLNTYNDGGPYDWSIQTSFDLAAGTIAFWAGETATILYDQWVELKLVIDLDNNTVDEYYNGELIATHEWDDNVNGTLGAIDLYGAEASSIYYDDITVLRLY